MSDPINVIFPGVQGARGDSGFPFVFEADAYSDVADDPGDGKVQFNNATLASATEVVIADQSGASGNPDMSAILAKFGDGRLIMRKSSDPDTVVAFFDVETFTDRTTHYSATITDRAILGSFADADAITIEQQAAGGSASIGNNSVTNAKLADMAQALIKGRASGAGTGDPQDLTAAQVRTIINVEDGSTSDQTGAEIKTALFAESDTNNFDDAAKAKNDFISITQAVDLDAIETRVNELDASVILMGTWDASAGTFPGGGTAQAGESWIVSTGGTVDGVVFTANDRIVAITDNASTATYASNWHKLDYTDAVLSVFGRTGAVSLLGSDIAGAGGVLDTGNETIAGVKTFSDDPIIPDEAYGVGWDGSLEPATKNALYDKIETLGSGVSDGDKGDIVVSGSGANWKFDGGGLTETWDDGGSDFHPFTWDVTNTASGAGSTFARWQLGGVDRFMITKGGGIRFGSDLDSGLIPGSADGKTIDWTRDSVIYMRLGVFAAFGGNRFGIGSTGAVPLVDLYAEAAGVLQQRGGATAQAFQIYNTYTDASNYERAELRWDTNVFKIDATSAGTGTDRQLWITSNLGTFMEARGTASLWFRTSGLDRWRVINTGHIWAGADNSYDIGASASSRPRTYYAGTSFSSVNGAAGTPSFVFASAAGFYSGGANHIGAVNSAAAEIFTGTSFGGMTVADPNSWGWASGEGLFRQAADTLAQRRGTNAQEFQLYNTYTDASNHERLSIKWDTNVIKIVGENAGTGSVRHFEITSGDNLTLQNGGSNDWMFVRSGDGGDHIFGGRENYGLLIFNGEPLGFEAGFTGNADVAIHRAAAGVVGVYDDRLKSNGGAIAFPDAGELTIATGAVTASGGYHTVDTESDAASDDLDTISGGTDGMLLVIQPENGARTVVAKDGTGNLQLNGDFSMDNAQDTLTLIYSGALSAWVEIARSNNGA